MQLTKNFHLNEFACRDGSETPCEAAINIKELAINLQVLRDDIKKPISINSGYRSPSYNKRIGGAAKSEHLTGRAGDIVVGGMTPLQVHTKIDQLIKAGKMKNGGLGIYNTFVHYDVRDIPARWDERRN